VFFSDIVDQHARQRQKRQARGYDLALISATGFLVRIRWQARVPGKCKSARRQVDLDLLHLDDAGGVVTTLGHGNGRSLYQDPLPSGGQRGDDLAADRRQRTMAEVIEKALDLYANKVAR
jgi:hypothetical protein